MSIGDVKVPTRSFGLIRMGTKATIPCNMMILRSLAFHCLLLTEISESFILLRNLHGHKIWRASSPPRLTVRAAVAIRNFQPGDARAIQRLLTTSDDSLLSFDPEGPLEVDCGTDMAIQESYLSEDDGRFLVAYEDDDNDSNATIIGTAGLVIGTVVSYQSSGASLSKPTMTTGAVRRVCGKTPAICRQLVLALESKCEGDVDELIALAYPDNENTAPTAVVRPTANVLESLAYVRSESQLRGTNVIQYTKRLDSSVDDDKKPESRIQSSYLPEDVKDNSSIDGVVEALAAGVLVLLVVAFTSVPQFMGIDVYSDANNRGLGSPLSSQELNRLQQDEGLQRTQLDEGENERQWQDLAQEEQKEELALMKIIQGQDIRVK